jgi:hypothetical protein
VFDRLGILVDLDQAPEVVDPDDLDGDQRRVGPEEAHLYPDVRDGVPPVDKDVVNPADPLVVPVVDVVLLAALLERRERVGADLSVHNHSSR